MTREWLKQNDGLKLVASLPNWLEYHFGWENPKERTSEFVIRKMLEPKEKYDKRILKVYGFGFRWIVRVTEQVWFEHERKLEHTGNVTTKNIKAIDG